MKFVSPILLLALVLIPFLSPQPTHACSCEVLNQRMVDTADKVFLGRIMERKHVGDSWHYKLSVPMKLKGAVDPIEWAQEYDHSEGNCGFSPREIGVEYVFIFYNLPNTPESYNKPYQRFNICTTARLESWEEWIGPSQWENLGNVCPRQLGKIPREIQQNALRYPHGYRDWGTRSGPPFYSWYTWLSLQNPGLKYNPLSNSAVWKSGC